MIKYLLKSNSPLFWIIFHFILGLISLISPYPLIIWFYLALISSIFIVLRPNTPPFAFVAIVVYFISFELLARMSKTSPFIPYEMGKYLLLLLLLLGIFKYKVNTWFGLVMVLLLIPGILIDKSGEVEMMDLVFNFIGPLNVALAIMFFYKKKISVSKFKDIIRLGIYPLIGVLSQTLFNIPDLDEVEFSLGANAITSGGFGSNQVSTGLGLAAFLVFILWINRWEFSKFRWLDGVLFFFFTLQGLLTFSRGGMIGTIVGIIIILLFLRTSSVMERREYQIVKIGKYLIPAIILVAGSFYFVNQITDGMLLLRYQGETAGTMTGGKIRSLNTFTSGRYDIFMGDILLWMENPIVGVGVGASRYLRTTMDGVIAHIELSRLLAEHGLFGLTFFLTLVYYGLQTLKSSPNPAIRGIMVAMFIFGIYTSFHAAMRTFITPLTIGLSMIYIYIPKTGNKKIPVLEEKIKPTFQES